MHGDQAGFCMWIWELFYFLNHRAVTRYKPGNDILYLEGNKATGKKKNLACSGVQCSLAGLLKGKSFSTDVLLSKETSITLIATQTENLFFGHPCTYTHRKKRMFPIIITRNIS